jgi:hypothetical protein
MTIKEVHRYFGGNWSLAMRQLNLGNNTHFYWRKKGVIPMGSQVRIEHATGGKLKAKKDEKDVD